MGKLMQVAAFAYEIDMAMVRNRLEELGIRTYVKDEHVNALREFSAGSLNGVKILVEESDYERAMEFLIEIGHYTAKDFELNFLERFLQKLFGKSK
ncbi:MAG: DUF2007 domain-containing protein [Chitinophagales bacterium]|nr:DUF2007 domain-containing protein [Bacteroidota bacterium]MCB9255967.1 DUF2007 domain-containing protein [Chitinophagales bacterium]